MNIIIISNEPWGDIWYSKHHYAFELSRNNNVVFINPTKKWRFSNLFKSKIEVEKISDSLTVLQYSNFLPSFFLKLNNRTVSNKIQSFLSEKLNFKSDVFWTFDPMRLYDPNYFKVRFSIFHAVDKYYFTHPAEKKLHHNVNAFISVSKDFVEQYQIYGKPILVIPHGLSEDEFQVNEDEFPINHSNYILYVGVIDKRLDFEIIRDMLIKFPNETFLFVGSIIDQSNDAFIEIFKEKKFPNLIWVPATHAKNLKYYIQKSKFCIAPMKKQILGNLISHHKILQYMAHGKAVFSPVFTEYVDWSDLLHMENNNEKLLNRMEDYLMNGEDEKNSEKRIEIAKNHQYKFHLMKIMNLINFK